MKQGQIIATAYCTKYVLTQGILEFHDMEASLSRSDPDGRLCYLEEGSDELPGDRIYLRGSGNERGMSERLGHDIFLTRNEAIADANLRIHHALQALEKKRKKLEALKF